VKKFASLTLMVALMLGIFGTTLPRLAAEELKPVVTVSFAGYDEVLANIETIGKLGGNPQLAKGLEGMLNMVTQGKGLNGLDKKAPWGIIVQTDGQEKFTGFGFVPVTDLKQLMEVAKSSPAGDSIKESDGVYEVANPNSGETMYIAQRGKIAAIVKDKAELESIPADPTKLLGDLPQKYLVAVQASAGFDSRLQFLH
jgi:hypothetical protein